VIQASPQMRIFVAIEPADFRKGIDGLRRLCKTMDLEDPYSGALFVFRNRRGTAIKILAYDGQGYWLCHKRLSQGRFQHWPRGDAADAQHTQLLAHELQVLLSAGDPQGAKAAPQWRALGTPRTTP
jgi:transposase